MKSKIIYTICLFLYTMAHGTQSNDEILQDTIKPADLTIDDLFIAAMRSKDPTALLAALRPAAEYDPTAQKKLWDFLTNKNFAPHIGLSLDSNTDQESHDLYIKGLKQNQSWALDQLRNDLKQPINDLCETLFPTTGRLNPTANKRDRNTKKAHIDTFHTQWAHIPHPLPTFLLLLTLQERYNESKARKQLSTLLLQKLNTMSNHEQQWYEFDEADTLLSLIKKKITRHHNPAAIKSVKDYIYVAGRYGKIATTIDAAMLLCSALIKEMCSQDTNSSQQYLSLLKQNMEKGDPKAKQLMNSLLPSHINGSMKKTALLSFQKAADNGDIEAMISAGKLLRDGFEGQEPDKAKALALFQKAADKGDATAMFYAGHLLQSGFQGQDPDLERAYNFFTKGAAKGDLDSINSMALLLCRGFEGQNPNKKRALNLFRQTAAKGNALGMYNTGVLLEQGFEGQEPDKKQALQFYLKAAKKGRSDAMHSAASLLERGFEGHPPQTKRAIKFYLQAAENGNVNGLHSAGLLIKRNTGDHKPDRKRAFTFCQQAIEKGCPGALNSAGVLIEQGFEGQEPDEEKAFEFYQKAADHGILYGLHNAARLLYKGFKGQEPDVKRALKLFQEAIKKGCIDSIAYAAWILEHGCEGQEPDKKQALKLLENATQIGCKHAIYQKGLLLQDGFDGQEANKAEALALFRQAAKKDHIDAMNKAALLLQQGFTGQSPDKMHASHLFIQAAEKGHIGALNNIGFLLKQGFDGQKPDQKKALKYFLKAAKQNDSTGMVQVAIILLTYKSVHQHESALFWLEKAKALGNKAANRYIEIAQQYLDSTDNIESDSMTQTLDTLITSLETNTSEDHDIDPKKIMSAPQDMQDYIVPEADKKTATSMTAETKEESDEKDSSDSEEYGDAETDQDMQEPYTDTTAEQKRLHLMHQMKKLNELYKTQTQCDKPPHLKLSKDSLETIQKIRQHNYNVSDNDLIKLFKDPFFQKQICITGKKSGIAVIAHKRDTNEHMTCSKHVKHTKGYKGQHRSFIQDLNKMLDLFGV